MLEKVAWINMLYDFYGQLLTGRQRAFIELYYSQDLSLGEIAGEYGVSRQAVYDALKRSAGTLEDYEARLGLVKKFALEKKKLTEVGALLDEYRESGEGAKLDTARLLLAEIIDMS